MIAAGQENLPRQGQVLGYASDTFNEFSMPFVGYKVGDGHCDEGIFTEA